jgi:hypothetical protein
MKFCPKVSQLRRLCLNQNDLMSLFTTALSRGDFPLETTQTFPIDSLISSRSTAITQSTLNKFIVKRNLNRGVEFILAIHHQNTAKFPEFPLIFRRISSALPSQLVQCQLQMN